MPKHVRERKTVGGKVRPPGESNALEAMSPRVRELYSDLKAAALEHLESVAAGGESAEGPHTLGHAQPLIAVPVDEAACLDTTATVAEPSEGLRVKQPRPEFARNWIAEFSRITDVTFSFRALLFDGEAVAVVGDVVLEVEGMSYLTSPMGVSVRGINDASVLQQVATATTHLAVTFESIRRAIQSQLVTDLNAAVGVEKFRPLGSKSDDASAEILDVQEAYRRDVQALMDSMYASADGEE